MTAYMVLPLNTFNELMEKGAMDNPNGSDVFVAYTRKPTRIQAVKVADFTDKAGAILTLEIPEEDCTVTAADSRISEVFGKVPSPAEELEFNELCLIFVRGMEPFGNERFWGDGSWKDICKKTPAQFLMDKLGGLSEEDKRNGIFPALSILEASDLVIMKYYMDQIRFNVFEMENLLGVIREYLQGEYGEFAARHLGLYPFGRQRIQCESLSDKLCRAYFIRQAKAITEEDRLKSYEILRMLEADSAEAINYHGPLEISVKTTGLPIGALDENAYRTNISTKKAKVLYLRYVVQGALYLLRTREAEMVRRQESLFESKDNVATKPPYISLTISNNGRVLMNIWRVGHEYVIIDKRLDETDDAEAVAVV